MLSLHPLFGCNGWFGTGSYHLLQAPCCFDCFKVEDEYCKVMYGLATLCSLIFTFKICDFLHLSCMLIYWACSKGSTIP